MVTVARHRLLDVFTLLPSRSPLWVLLLWGVGVGVAVGGTGVLVGVFVGVAVGPTGVSVAVGVCVGVGPLPDAPATTTANGCGPLATLAPCTLTVHVPAAADCT